MKVYLIRHGQTDWNAARRVQGRENIPLNAAGRRQAEEVAQALAGCSAVRILTSPLDRARQTAMILADALGSAAPVEEPGLTERDYGPLTGKPYAEGQDLYSFTESHPEGMETLQQVAERALDVLKRACALPGDTILVSHGGTINILLWALTGGRLGYGVTRLKNACVSVLEGSPDGSLRVLVCNLTAEEWTRFQAAQEDVPEPPDGEPAGSEIPAGS